MSIVTGQSSQGKGIVNSRGNGIIKLVLNCLKRVLLMGINLPQITKAERTNAILFFVLTLLPIIIFLFVNKLVAFGFILCTALRFLELWFISKYGDKLK